MDAVDWVQALTGVAAVAITAAAAWIAFKQTQLATSQATSAQRQTEIAQTLQQLELQRDRPILVASQAQIVGDTLILELVNAGGGAAVKVKIFAIDLRGTYLDEEKRLSLPGLNSDGFIPCVRDTVTHEVPLATLAEHLKAFRPRLVDAMVGEYYDTSGDWHSLDYEREPGMADALRTKFRLPVRPAREQ